MHNLEKIDAPSHEIPPLPSHLFSHRFRIGYGRAEVAIPLEPSVQAGPVIVTIGGVRQAPGNKRIALLLRRRFARLAGRARADATKSARSRRTTFDVIVSVFTAKNTRKGRASRSSATYSFLITLPSESRISSLGRSRQSAPG